MKNAFAASGTSPTGRTSISPTHDVKTTPLTLADRIEQTARALTADELSKILTVSRIHHL